ncbi:MAG: branched-chain amino acid ABC transporter permease [Pseudomonadota bacterium]
MNMLADPNFFAVQVLNSISLGMNLFIIAAGLSLIFGVLRVINFAHGAFYMFGAYITYTVTQEWGGNFWWGVVGAAVGLALMAIVIERALFRFIYDKEHLMQLLLTFGIVLVLGDVAKMIWGTDQYSVSYPPALSGATDLGIEFNYPVIYPSYRLVLCVIGPLIFLGLWLFIEKTRWGRLTKAATQDREMLAALGINVPLVYTAVFILGSALAGVGGALASPINSPTPGMDATIIVECFVIVIIGGLGSLWGTFLGALIYGIVFNFGSVIVPNGQDIFAFLLLMIVLMVRPWGLFGQPEGGH